jgi:hypothetical protein
VILDETPSDADPSADLLLRGFFVDAGAQGAGVATRAVAALPDVVRRDFPAPGRWVLTVNVRNPVGARGVRPRRLRRRRRAVPGRVGRAAARPADGDPCGRTGAGCARGLIGRYGGQSGRA